MLNPKVDRNVQIVLIVLIHSSLIDYKTYLPYCDSKILEIKNPPEWLLDLAMNSNAYDNGSNKYFYIEDKEFFHNLEFSDLILSCYYIGYKVGLWDWKHFLFQSGCYSDAFSCKWYCDDFFYPLNDYQINGYNLNQKVLEAKFLKDFKEEISFMNKYYKYFKQFYKGDY